MVASCILAYPYLQSLVMCGNMFKYNCNGLCQREKYINIHILYEHTCFSFFMIIPLLLMLMTARHIPNMWCVSMNNNKTNLFGEVYHFTFWLQQTNMSLSSHCRTSIFEEEFLFQSVRGDICIHIITQNIILTFLSKWDFAWQCKQGNLS